MPDDLQSGQELNHIRRLALIGQLDQAEAACRKLLELTPLFAPAWRTLGQILTRKASYVQAEEAFRAGLALQPSSAELWCELSLALNRQGKPVEAEAAARRATEIDPSSAAHWSNLASALLDQQRWPEAIAALHRSLALDSQSVPAWNNLGTAELKQSHFSDSQTAYERALALAPAHPGTQANYAYLLCCRGDRQQAAEWLERALIRDPSRPEAWEALGSVWQMMAEWSLAAAAYRRALACDPNRNTARLQLARTLRSERQLTAAEQTIRELLQQEPQNADGQLFLGEILAMQGRAAEAIGPLRHAVELAPSDGRHACLLMISQYDDRPSASELLAAHREWDRIYSRPLLPANPARPRKALGGRPLRIGFVSADFGRHPTAFFVLPLLEHIDRQLVEVVCYCDRAAADEFTARFRAASASWRQITAQTDEQVAAQIERDRIDILVDLMGHTGKRLFLFARKPAPLQVTWFGYVGTTAMAAMDCILADQFHIRAGEEDWYSEKVLRLPHGYACYDPPADAPAVQPLPALRAGHVTLGCFNNLAKYSPRIIDAWAAILRRAPTAKLLLKTGGLGDLLVQRRLGQQFAARGIDPVRLAFEDWSPPGELLSAYNRVDLALDTQPYSGGLTTCEALWMGVPVITFPGRTFAGRHSTSHLTNACCSEFVAADLGGYVERCVEWAGRLQELAAIRRSLRDKMSHSPLCNAPRFARDFAAMLSQAWKSIADS